MDGASDSAPGRGQRFCSLFGWPRLFHASDGKCLHGFLGVKKVASGLPIDYFMRLLGQRGPVGAYAASAGLFHALRD
jgi:hypothetical protein